MAFLNLQYKLMSVDRVLAVILVIVAALVCVPLTVITFQEGGGPWGFGIVGLHILLPLSAYSLFALVTVYADRRTQWKLFVSLHVICLCVAWVSFLSFPVLPGILLLLPTVLALVSILKPGKMFYFLCLVLCLAIACNLILLKWEVDFGRSLPIIRMMRPTSPVEALAV